MGHRRRLSRALIPVAIAITTLTVVIPVTPAFATDPVPVDPAPTPAPVEPAPAPVDPAPAPVVVAPTTTVVATSTRRSRAHRLIAVARRKLGDRYVYGAAGPRRFDCSGLVLFTLRQSHNRHAAPLGGRSADSFWPPIAATTGSAATTATRAISSSGAAAATSGSTSATAGRSAP